MQYDPNIAIARSFEARAEAYELHADLQASIADRLALLLPPLEAPRVLELGCGTGQLSLFLASADRRVVGADLTRPSLELAQAAAERYGVPNVQFVETDLRTPGLRRGAFDVVICSGVLHHTPDPRAAFAAVARLARPGGVLAIGLIGALVARFRPQGMVRAMQATAAAQGAMALYALFGGYAEVTLHIGMFVIPWLLSAQLFKKAAREQAAAETMD